MRDSEHCVRLMLTRPDLHKVGGHRDGPGYFFRSVSVFVSEARSVLYH